MAEHTRLDYRELKVELARGKFALAIANKWWEYSPWQSRAGGWAYPPKLPSWGGAYSHALANTALESPGVGVEHHDLKT